MKPESEFKSQVCRNIAAQGEDSDFRGLTNIWIRESIRHSYALNFTWMDRPIIQVPQDIYAIQELIWSVKPDLIIETGVAHGGSLIMSASMLALIDYTEAAVNDRPLNPRNSRRRVVGIDIDIRPHNRAAIESHPMSHMIELIEGSSTSHNVVKVVEDMAKSHKTVMVFLDSNHTHDHVLSELEHYAPLVSAGSYCVVWDSGIEDLPENFITDRPWGKGNNPKTALFTYLSKLKSENKLATDGERLMFEVDKFLENKIMITASTDGFLKRVKEVANES
jgi:cephalosporin hydroxylase